MSVCDEPWVGAVSQAPRTCRFGDIAGADSEAKYEPSKYEAKYWPSELCLSLWLQ